MPDSLVEFSVDSALAGLRIDKCVSLEYESLSRSFVSRLLKEGRISLNGSPFRKASQCPQEGDVISCLIPEPKETEILPEEIPLTILYEDQDVLVVDKPKGMVVHPAPGHYTGTLVNALLFHCRDLSGINGYLRPGIVHRIDRDTTGSLIVCKNDFAHRSIAEQLSRHSLDRRYHAIVRGGLSEDGTVSANLGRSRKDRKKMAVTPEGRPAVTHYHVLERFQGYTYIECVLETGRTHQIRVHMAHIGHSVLGDPVYGSGKSPFSTEGQVLHAKTIGFQQPHTGERITVDSPLPAYFTEILRKLRS